MGIFQCVECGCTENTATGWYHSRFSKRLTRKEDYGKALCSVCAPTSYPDGTPTKFTGVWHRRFKRTFFLKGTVKKNDEGNLEHIETGLTGNELYERYGSDTPFPIEPDGG